MRTESTICVLDQDHIESLWHGQDPYSLIIKREL